MKKMILALALVSSVSFAGALSAEFPKVSFGNVFVGIDGVCVNGANLQTLAPVDVCVAYGSGDGAECLKSESKILSTPLTYSREIAVNEGQYTTITETTPTTYSVPMGYMGGEAGFVAVSSESYTIPACK